MLKIFAILPMVLLCMMACTTKFESSDADDLSDAGDPDQSESLIDGDVPADEAVTPCDPEETPDPEGIYVTPSAGGDDANSGDATHPVRTIAVALALARTLNRTVIYLDRGTYGERVDLADLPGGVTLEGGWQLVGQVWRRSCEPGARAMTLIASPDLVGVTATGLTAPSGLKRLTVTTAPGGVTPGDAAALSRIALLVRGSGSSFRLQDVSLQPGAGDDGGQASPGAAGGAPACLGIDDCGDGAEGFDQDPAGAASGQGVFDENGFTPADGQPGTESGTDGTNGTQGPSQSSPHPYCNVGCTCPACDGNQMAPAATAHGRCGCGGKGGGPGMPGRGGGASVALLVVGELATAYAEGSELAASDGGAGMPGGEGGPGSQGTPGEAVTLTCHTGGCVCVGTCPGEDCAACYYWDSHDGRPGPTPYTAGPGGNGGDGGGGAAGGAGAGGPSFAVVTAGGARFVEGAGNALTFGAGGASGGGDVPAGAQGALFSQP